LLRMRIKHWAFIALCCMVVSCAHDPHSVSVIDATSASYGKKKALYKVRKGDTLYSIAFRYGTTVAEIARLNNIKQPFVIHPGQQLLVLGHAQVAANQTQTKIISKPKAPAKPAPKPTIVKPKTPTAPPVVAAKPVTKVVTPPKVTPPAKPVAAKPKAPAAKPAVKPLPKVSLNKNEVWIAPSKGRLGKGYSLGKKPHKGQNYHGGLGSPVVASRSGTVVYAGDGLKSYGLLVIIKHDERYLSAYAYNRKITVKEGQYVKQGETVAEMGKKADTVTLHFEIRRDGKPVNPINLLGK